MVTSAVDFTQDVNLWVNAIIGTASDVVNLERYHVELIRG